MATTCPKCDGKGKIGYYAGIAGGVCFRCKGTGLITARSAQAARRTALRRTAADRKRIADLRDKEEAALARYGDGYRLAKALSRFDHPVAAQAAGVWADMRDGKPAWVIETGLTRILPAVMSEFGVTGLSPEEIEAEALARG
ncbi:hypothetical protein ACFV9E_18295 [Streptomyces sp. NPDC059835]|uniref:hypothetical protein n=1 Tax=Streptomyces sp. NPDC059835 TaxID=3346967 RepID=UPI0036474B73